MSELDTREITPKAIRLPESAWGPNVDGLTGDRMFVWRQGGRTVSQRYRATRNVVLVDGAGGRYSALADGVGGLFTKAPDRRQGFAADLMMASVTESRREGYTVGLLCCLPALMPWYRRLGWWMTRSVEVVYQRHSGESVTLSAPNLWAGFLPLSPSLPLLVSRVEIEGPLW